MDAQDHTPIVIEPLLPHHAVRVSKIEDTVYGRDAWTIKRFRARFPASLRMIDLVAFRGWKVVGYLLSWREAERRWLERLVVAPGHRRKGVARALLDDLGHRTTGVESDMRGTVSRDDSIAMAFCLRTGFAPENPAADPLVMVRPRGIRGHR